MTKAITLNGTTIIGVPKKWVRASKPGYEHPAYDTLSDEEHFLDGWKEVITPEFNSETHKLGELKDYENKFEYDVDPLTQQEIEANFLAKQNDLIEDSEANKQQLIQAKTEAKIIEDAQLIEDDTEAIANQALYPFWDENNIEVFEGHKYQRIVGLELHLYKVKVGKGHYTQANWAPENNPSLFTRVGFADEAVPWTSTAASAGEYILGYKVTHNGQTWISIFNGANAWEPGEYGWEVFTG
ncbi:hypothetical protein HSX10_03740 [Winogradskyella undariae]|uniref:hypothetical protein n=1 Tax=Winogradskyella undariae TaxID=1285465 RepID=UPI00156B6401|nr:hypothetical protein [Winogradskyella undariae]NRR90672.1 hypothetical protein [Winogradskyella undariae]